MKLISMKRSKKEQNREKNDMAVPMSRDEYPYGLTLELSTEQLDKLDIDQLPKVGKKYRLHAECAVKSASVHERDGKRDRNLSLQVTRLALSSSPTSGVDALEDGLEQAGSRRSRRA